MSDRPPTPHAGVAHSEAAPRHALQRHDLLRESHRDAFDRIARLAVRAIDGSAGGVWLVETDRIRVAGSDGAASVALRRGADALCRRVVDAGDVVAVPDAAADARFRDELDAAAPEASSEGPARFYLGAPVVVDGNAVGSVWACGAAARCCATDAEREALRDLAAMAASELKHRVAQQHLGDIVQHAADAIFTLAPDGTLVSLNPAFERITGHAVDAWRGRRFDPLVHPDDAERARDALGRVLGGHEVGIELRVVSPEGEVRPVDVMAVPRFSDGRVVQVFGFARDARERTGAEARLREQAELLAERESRLERLARASTDAMWDMDPETDRIWWSEGFERLFGYPVDAYDSADRWEERIHPDDYDRVLAEHRAAIDARQPTWQDEYRYRRADGTYAYVLDRAHLEYDGDGKLSRIYGGMVDISERKEAEMALQRSEQLFKDVYANAPIGIYRTTPEGRVLLANDALVRMLGFDRFEELAKRDIETEGYDDMHPRSEFRARVESQSSVEGFETVWLRRDRTPLMVREYARAVRDDDGNVVYYEGTVEDISERRRFEDALRRLVELPGTRGEGLFSGRVGVVAEALQARWAMLVRPSADGRLEVVASHGAEPPAMIDGCEPVMRALNGSSVEILAGLPFHCETGSAAVGALAATALLAEPVHNTQGDVTGALLVLHDAPLARPTNSDRWLLTAFSQRAGAELEERDHLHRLEASARAAEVLRSAESVSEVFRRATSEVLSATSASSVCVIIHDPASDRLVVEYAAGASAEHAAGSALARGAGVSWDVFDTGKPRFVPDLTTEEGAVYFAGEPRPGAWAGAPLRDQRGRVFGVLTADTIGGPSFRNLLRPDLHYLEAMAQTIGVSVARLRALERARTESGRFRSLAELSARLELIDDPLEIARTALEALLPLTGFTLGSMWTVEGAKLQRILSVGETTPLADAALDGRDLSRRHGGVLERVIESRNTVWIPEYAEHPDALPKYVGAGMRSMVATPLLEDGDAFGALVLGTFDHVMPVNDETQSLLQAVARRVQRALQRASSRRELVATREEALRALGLALEYRDYETKGHTDRVTALARQLGAALGLDESQLQNLRWGAYLHDAGKVSIPDHILLKPGKLDAAEWRRMKEHVTIGETMLRELGFIPDEVLALVRHHHEQWDGSGYPDGLAGADIPLLARIFHVVDVYDALISERPYKAAWLHPEALGELEGQSGRQFDPRVVGTFLRLVSTRNSETRPVYFDTMTGSAHAKDDI